MNSPGDQARPRVKVSGLSVTFASGAERQLVVDNISFELLAGQILALVGESGSGKSVTGRVLLGLAGKGAEVSAEHLQIEGDSVLGDDEHTWQARRGRQVGLILQDALVSLDPRRTIGAEIREVLDAHQLGSKDQRSARVLHALVEAGVPEPLLRSQQRSGQLSGGLRQRALIAAAIAGEPRILIADEPTTALDSSTQRQVLSLLRRLAERGDAILLITHDMAVVSEIADQVAVMQNGRIVESGATAQVLGAPQHAYTQALLAALPAGKPKGVRLSDAAPIKHAGGRAPALVEKTPAIAANQLGKHYQGRVVLENVSFSLAAGQTLGLVGESGAGKSTLARILLGQLAPDNGSVHLLGHPWSTLSERHRRPLRPALQMIYQDPLGSFDPRLDVRRILRDALQAIAVTDKATVQRRSLQLLDFVGLSARHLERSPRLLSGGQRQRVAIARALATEPSILLCDEPVSALDASTQAQVLDLLSDIQRELGLSYLFISHDLDVIHHVSDEILVLRQGRVVEQGPAEALYKNPREPYTRQLLNDLPRFIAPQSHIQPPLRAAKGLST